MSEAYLHARLDALQQLIEVYELCVLEQTEVARKALAEAEQARCQRERVVAELVASREEFASIVEHGQDGIMLVSDGSQVLFANKTAELRLGSQNLVSDRYDPPRPGAAAEIRIVDTGERRFLEVSASDTVWQGQPAILVNLRDVTQKELLAEEQRRTSRLLARSHGDLRQTMSVLSHELAAPLQGIERLSSWIEQDLQNKLDEQTRENMALLRTRVRRMGALLQSLHTYLGCNPQKSKVEFVELPALTQDLRKKLKFPEDFRIELTGSPLRIEIELEPFKQVLSELLHNAKQHHDQGAGRIELNVRREPDHYVLHVCDDGPGIPRELRDKAFHFFQTLKPRDTFESSGAGLAIAQKIVESLGGSITLISQIGKGSTFRIIWPIRPAEPREAGT